MSVTASTIDYSPSDTSEGSTTNEDSSGSPSQDFLLPSAPTTSSTSTSPSLHSPDDDIWAMGGADGLHGGQGARPKQRTGPPPCRSPDTEDSCKDLAVKSFTIYWIVLELNIE